ncbi:hypothetical protein CMV_013256 [Castanea mollissima]|uniref:Uncharacterized protein n=1 Tax=Castanea mollissima TaxID=60419 RepID=A0A8J4QYG9_9ROSI|nr:hypothetical protein CMV_013256 [Castanea mollissima]
MVAETAAAVGQGLSAGGFEFLLIYFYFHFFSHRFPLLVLFGFVLYVLFGLFSSLLFSSVNCDFIWVTDSNSDSVLSCLHDNRERVVSLTWTLTRLP